MAKETREHMVPCAGPLTTFRSADIFEAVRPVVPTMGRMVYWFTEDQRLWGGSFCGVEIYGNDRVAFIMSCDDNNRRGVSPEVVSTDPHEALNIFLRTPIPEKTT